MVGNRWVSSIMLGITGFGHLGVGRFWCTVGGSGADRLSHTVEAKRRMRLGEMMIGDDGGWWRFGEFRQLRWVSLIFDGVRGFGGVE